MKRTFSPAHHFPKYSRLVLETIRMPAVIFFVVAGNVVLFASLGLFYYFEAERNPQVSSLMDALWWGMATITTVGFGDIVPHTLPGRIIGLVLMGTGVILFVGATALFISAFFARVGEDMLETENLSNGPYEDIMQQLSSLHKRLERIESVLSDKHPSK